MSKEKFEIVALDNSFHGRTIGALSATGQVKYRQDFEPLVPGFRFVRFNDIAELTASISDRTCAVIGMMRSFRSCSISRPSSWTTLA